MTKKSRKRQAISSLDELDEIQIIEYEITTEPILDQQYRKLPRSVQDAFEQLHHTVQSQPRKVIPELLEWIEKYPNIPLLYNYLSVAYSMTGRHKEMEATILENYRRNPDYLFARLNYAELFLRQGDYERVAEILEHKFDLKLLYPERNRFHLTEVSGFMGLVGLYFVGIGKRSVAVKYLKILEQIAPNDPMTQRLRQKLRAGSWRRWLRKFIRRLQRMI